MEVPSSQTALVCVSSKHKTSQHNAHTHKNGKRPFRHTSMAVSLVCPSRGCIGGERTFGLEMALVLPGLCVTQIGDSGWKAF